jgi:uncharacterized protein (TIGR02117 family)
MPGAGNFLVTGGILKEVRVLLVLLALASGCTTLPEATKPAAQGQSPSNQSIYVVSHGWHTGIVFPRERLLEFVPDLKSRFPAGEYLEIGWGDKGFYQANEITSGITLKAILWPTETVVHVVAVPRSPHESFPHSEIRLICLDQSQIESLARFLSNSFSRDQANQIISTKKGIYGDSQFYVGVGSFHLFNTCNKWTAKGLESAGFEINATLKLTASSILGYLDANQNPDRAQQSDTVSAPQALCH